MNQRPVTHHDVFVTLKIKYTLLFGNDFIKKKHHFKPDQFTKKKWI
jgi:hypothetical protein